MQSPEVLNPESTSDASDGERADALPPQKRTHGGSRNTKRFGDKILALEDHNIRYFLDEKRCYCENNCLLKLHYKGQEGEQVVYKLREQRFASESSQRHTTTTDPFT